MQAEDQHVLTFQKFAMAAFLEMIPASTPNKICHHRMGLAVASLYRSCIALEMLLGAGGPCLSCCLLYWIGLALKSKGFDVRSGRGSERVWQGVQEGSRKGSGGGVRESSGGCHGGIREGPDHPESLLMSPGGSENEEVH